MVSGVRAIGILPDHGYMLTFADDFKAKRTQDGQNFRLGSINGEFGMAQTNASATNASKAGSSDSKDSRPNVST